MAIVFIAAVLICLLLLLVLYRNLPNKKVFYGFCLVLALTIGAIGQSLLFQPKAEPPSEIALRRIAAQQQIFDDWYTSYKKQLDSLDYNWAQGQKIVNDYHNDNISLNTAYTRLNLLEHQAQVTNQELSKLVPPISLDDTNYDLAASILNKTIAYSEKQLAAITALKANANPANLSTDNHEEESRILWETMLRNGPDALFTAAETNSLRQNLTIPEN